MCLRIHPYTSGIRNPVATVPPTTENSSDIPNGRPTTCVIAIPAHTTIAGSASSETTIANTVLAT